MKIASLVLALSVSGAGIASAQSLPPITKSKAAAQKAVDATNDHTRRMTAPQRCPRSAGSTTIRFTSP